MTGHDPAMTLGEVAAVLGVSRQRVAQIEAQALDKLRRALAERGYSAEHFLDVWRAAEGREGRGRVNRHAERGEAL
jgi:hypothetical protein